MFKLHEDVVWEETQEIGLEVAKSVSGEGLQMILKRFEAGGVEQLHSEDVPLVGYVLEGRFQMLIEGEGRNLGTGDAYIIPPEKNYGLRALTAGRLLEVRAEAED